jgi:hypothetical protein
VIVRWLHSDPRPCSASKSSNLLYNLCVVVTFKIPFLTDLPTAWDLCSSTWLRQGLERLRVETVTGEGPALGDLYVIKPNTLFRDSSVWFVATTSPTAVLFAFRKRLLSMHEIATTFFDLGIPFHTVVERMKQDTHILPYRYRPRGLDARPMGFTPSELDYRAYVQPREEVFRSPRAPVLRLRGGIIGKLALEAVPNVAVLDGPSFCDDVIRHTITPFLSTTSSQRTTSTLCLASTALARPRVAPPLRTFRGGQRMAPD